MFSEMIHALQWYTYSNKEIKWTVKVHFCVLILPSHMHVSAHTEEEIIRKFSNRYLTTNIDNLNTFFIVVEIISKIYLDIVKQVESILTMGLVLAAVFHLRA